MRRELLRSLVGGLGAEWNGAAAACVALDGLLQSSSVPEAVAEVLGLLLEVLPAIEAEMPRHGALTVGHTLARCNLHEVMKCLLAQPATLPAQVTEYVQRLARDGSLVGEIVRGLAERLADEDAAEPAAVNPNSAATCAPPCERPNPAQRPWWGSGGATRAVHLDPVLCAGRHPSTLLRSRPLGNSRGLSSWAGPRGAAPASAPPHAPPQLADPSAFLAPRAAGRRRC